METYPDSTWLAFRSVHPDVTAKILFLVTVNQLEVFSKFNQRLIDKCQPTRCKESGSDLGCICRIYASTIKFGLAFRYGLPVQFGTFQHMCKPGLRYQYSTRTVHAVPLQADLVRRYRPKKYRYRGYETGTSRIPAYEVYLTSPKQIVATSRTTIVLNLLR